MGIMICEIHGRVGFVEACSHIGSEIDAGTVPSGHRLTIIGNLFVCDDCFNSLDFKRFASLAELPLEEIVEITDGRLEAYEAAYEAIEGRRSFCLNCLAELDRPRATTNPDT